MDFDTFLADITTNDQHGLLEVKKTSSAPTADEHLISKFSEINDFVAANGREPEADMANVSEFMLNQRLNSIRSNEEHSKALQKYDVHTLLYDSSAKVGDKSAPKSIDDLMNSDSLGLLNNDPLGIFKMKNVPKTLDMPGDIAKRKRCKDFAEYKLLFDECHADIDSGEKEQVKFTGEQQIQKGQFFILHGIYCYVADMEERVKKNGKVNAKLHLVFENGTESNMLLRSLATELYKDDTGRRIIPAAENSLDNMLGVTEEDRASGYIYILQSLSKNPEIASIQNLYKIGFASKSVEKRIANAENEPTYLMAPVHHVSSYKVFNVNAQKVENLLHTFFGKACLDVEVADSRGRMSRPREWFIAPLESIQLAVQLLANGEIVHYRYDIDSESIVER